MNINDNNEVATITAPPATSDLYQREMQSRLEEWHTRPLEPKLQSGHYAPLIVLTVILPVICLIGGWFL